MNTTRLFNSVPQYKNPLIFLCILLFLAMHLVAGINSLKRFVYLLRRHTRYHSDISLYRQQELKTYPLIQQIKRNTPLDANILVRCAGDLPAEVSFYVFPRRVKKGNASEGIECSSAERLTLEKINANTWVVAQP